MDAYFGDRNKLTVVVNDKRFDVIALANWKRTKEDAYSIAFPLPEELLLEMAKAKTFEVDADFPNALRDIDPSTEFGIVGLHNGLAALLKR